MQVFVIANEQFDGPTGLCWSQLESAVNSYSRRKALLADSFNNIIYADDVNSQHDV